MRRLVECLAKVDQLEISAMLGEFGSIEDVCLIGQKVSRRVMEGDDQNICVC